MLKELVRERLIAAADEIFGLFEKTIASYEEQLSRARAENERQRRQLEAVSASQMMLRGEDIRPLTGCQQEPSSQSQSRVSALDRDDAFNVKEEEEGFHIGNLPPPAVAVEPENEPPEWSELPHLSPMGDPFEGRAPDHLLAPLSNSDDDDMQEEATGAAAPTHRRTLRAFRGKAHVGARVALPKSPAAETTAASPVTEAHYEKTPKTFDCDMDLERKRKVSAVWDHFDLVSSMKVKCRICSTELSYVNKSTSSMLRHFRARHEHDEVANPPRITAASRKHALDQAVLNFIIKESQPLSIVESDGFRQLLRTLEPSYVLPSRKIVKEMGPKTIKNEVE
ncbi:uncharacterized protein LOC109526890 [Hippocampus comes]|uniref:uncharacterized protein LOC109526890 n=1 Tax=Hippocampus comes TaxID=109280 RepID=UPI00094E21D4|nr:PREDICTED: uncharacterized protein LOC109526890 [Hippocampus comes]